jgi:small subunit ribosomal protein S16
MAVRIRLKRCGTTKVPHWRIVVADARSPREGRFIENLGYYDPKTNPATIELNAEKLKQWITKGAQPTVTVRNLMKKKGIKN